MHRSLTQLETLKEKQVLRSVSANRDEVVHICTAAQLVGGKMSEMQEEGTDMWLRSQWTLKTVIRPEVADLWYAEARSCQSEARHCESTSGIYICVC